MAARAPIPYEDHPTLTGALDRMVDAVQAVVADQIAIARLEGETALRRWAVGGAVVAGGGLFALFAWAVALVAGHTMLRQYMHPAASLAILTGLNLAIGGGLIAYGLRTLGVIGRSEAGDGAS